MLAPAKGLTYKFEEGWAKIPAGKQIRCVASIAIDKDDNVYAFSRSDHPVMVFDRKGNFLDSWGQGQFQRPHGSFIGPDQSIYLTDDADQTVRKFTLDGKVLLTLGVSGKAAPAYSQKPFNRCTHTALSPDGDIYVSDGYGNACVHKYSAEGKHILTWGEPGVQPGQFNVVHNVCCDRAGWVYVADRESHRVQVFDKNGKFEAQWHNLHRPAWVFLRPNTELFYIAELGPDLDINRRWPNLGPRISIVDNQGKHVAQIHTQSEGEGHIPAPFAVPHGLAVDSRGDVYVADLAQQGWAKRFPNTKVVESEYATIRKLVRVD